MSTRRSRVCAAGVCPARWTVSSASTPAWYEAALEKRGLTLYDEWPGMVARIEDLPEPELREPTIEVVRTAAGSEEWAVQEGARRGATVAILPSVRGPAVEGKPPEFFHDWRFLMVGFRWWVAKVQGRA